MTAAQIITVLAVIGIGITVALVALAATDDTPMHDEFRSQEEFDEWCEFKRREQEKEDAEQEEYLRQYRKEKEAKRHARELRRNLHPGKSDRGDSESDS